MNPRAITAADLERFPGHSVVTMRAPGGMEDMVGSVDVLMSDEGIVMVPFLPDEIEVTKLADGATLWCVFMGVMPPMYVEVTETP